MLLAMSKRKLDSRIKRSIIIENELQYKLLKTINTDFIGIICECSRKILSFENNNKYELMK